MADDKFRTGREMARSWAQGKSELIDDLAALVEGMLKEEFGPVEKGFLSVVGETARAAAKGAARPAAGAPPPARPKAQTPAAPATRAPIDVDDSWRRARERAQQAKLDELWRMNSQIPLDCGVSSWRRPGDEWW
jgi:hypothetical protein